MRKRLILFLILLLACFTAACGKNSDDAATAPNSITAVNTPSPSPTSAEVTPLPSETAADSKPGTDTPAEVIPSGADTLITPDADPAATPGTDPAATPAADPAATPGTEDTNDPSRVTVAPTAAPTKEISSPGSDENDYELPPIPADPTTAPTVTPTKKPTAAPTKQPTAAPTKKPTATPTKQPTAAPTKQPTATPTKKPTAAPTESASITIPTYAFSRASGIPSSSAQKFAEKLRLGWNLGNCLDASNCTWLTNELAYESAWCGAKASKELITELKKAGFNTIRIPVSWHNHMDANDSTHTISAAWMRRVKEVVDYAISQNMYVILNVHHDNEKTGVGYYPSSGRADASISYLTDVWKQIATTFASYDEHLIFEVLNEPRLTGTNLEWWPYNDKTSYADAISNICKYNQVCLDTIRSTGGSNASKRYVLVTCYAASADSALNTYAGGFSLPKDSLSNHLLLSVHAYTPYNLVMNTGNGSTTSFGTSEKNEITNVLKKLYSTYVAKGTPVVLTEFGIIDKNNLQDRVNWSAYYVAAARSYGITCVYWDNNAYRNGSKMDETYGLIDRKSVTWRFPSLADAMSQNAD